MRLWLQRNSAPAEQTPANAPRLVDINGVLPHVEFLRQRLAAGEGDALLVQSLEAHAQITCARKTMKEWVRRERAGPARPQAAARVSRAPAPIMRRPAAALADGAHPVAAATGARSAARPKAGAVKRRPASAGADESADGAPGAAVQRRPAGARA
eukprot:5549414-Pyramimonas_sp.AAC.1